MTSVMSDNKLVIVDNTPGNLGCTPVIVDYIPARLVYMPVIVDNRQAMLMDNKPVRLDDIQEM